MILQSFRVRRELVMTKTNLWSPSIKIIYNNEHLTKHVNVSLFLRLAQVLLQEKSLDRIGAMSIINHGHIESK